MRNKNERKLHIVISHYFPEKEWLKFAYSSKIYVDKFQELTSERSELTVLLIYRWHYEDRNLKCNKFLHNNLACYRALNLVRHHKHSNEKQIVIGIG